MTLRVALIGPMPPPAGGMANQARQLVALLGRESIEVELVQTNPPIRPAWAAGVRGLRAVFRLPAYVATLWRALGRSQLAHLMANSGGTWFLCSIPAVVIARLRGVPILINYRGGGAEAFLRRHAWAVRPIVALAAALAVPSGFLQQVFGRFGMKAEVLPNIVDLARFSPDARPDSERHCHVIVTRHLEAIYDNATALRAFALFVAQVPQARLTIAGEGPLRSELEDLAARLGIARAVTFSGRIDNADIPALYRSASVFLNPSRVDNMPNSVLEALATGVPVVSTNVGGVPFMVEDGHTALLVPPGDADAMAAAMLRLTSDAELRGRLSCQGRELVRKYDWSRIRPQLIALYARLARSELTAGTRTT